MAFSGDIKKFSKKTMDRYNEVFAGAALEVFSRIVRRTPVGNPLIWENKKAPPGYVGGRLRSNWQMSINSPTEGELPIGQATPIPIPKSAGSVFVTNNLDYARAVEDGHSTQAPLGMVAITTVEFKDIVEGLSRE